MPLRNRVTPLGDLVAVPERGLVYGNRGCLHDAAGRIVRRSATKRWIACRLEFRGWYRNPTPRPGKYTGLFFLDDATAFAAGHRPCALCRREDYDRVQSVLGAGGADALDARLHAERTGAHARGRAESLPDGAFALHADVPHVVVDGRLRPWSPGGYGRVVELDGEVDVITPSSLVHVLRTGWEPVVPFLHPSAQGETIRP
ncbi:MAG: hypothetical protein ACXVRJ_02930 [Gaiellaceae bacterium]